MEINKLQEILYEEYCKNGYKDMWNSSGKVADIAELGLIVTEISEAMEEVRNKNTDMNHVEMECADILIRVINFMTRKGLSAEKGLLSCIQKNEKREKLHGKDV